MVGPEGCGKEEASRAFAGILLSGTDSASDRINELALRGAHPDLHEVRREGASILVEQANEVIRIASVTPSEGSGKVIIMHEVNLMQPTAIARLLKTLEEPPPGVHFIMLADQIDDTLATIASRCITIHFGLLDAELIEKVLIDEGSHRHTAQAAAASAQARATAARVAHRAAADADDDDDGHQAQWRPELGSLASLLDRKIALPCSRLRRRRGVGTYS